MTAESRPTTSALGRARDWFVTPPPPTRDRPAPLPEATPPASPSPPAAGAEPITMAAVLGRPDEAEPVAAAVALVLSQAVRARAAIVAVLRAAPAAPGPGGSAAAPPAPGPGGTRGARRLAARLGAHGLAARPQGRLVWVRLSADEAHVTVRRVAAMGAPVVFAVTAPRTPALDELLAEQDLIVVVTADAEGPLARLALAVHPATRTLVAPPLRRGPARSLARGGVRPARAIRELIARS